MIWRDRITVDPLVGHGKACVKMRFKIDENLPVEAAPPMT